MHIQWDVTVCCGTKLWWMRYDTIKMFVYLYGPLCGLCNTLTKWTKHKNKTSQPGLNLAQRNNLLTQKPPRGFSEWGKQLWNVQWIFVSWLETRDFVPALLRLCHCGCCDSRKQLSSCSGQQLLSSSAPVSFLLAAAVLSLLSSDSPTFRGWKTRSRGSLITTNFSFI